MRHRSTGCILALLACVHLPLMAEDAEKDATEWMAEITGRAPVSRTAIYGVFKLRLPDNQRREIPIKLITELVPSGWSDVWETQPVEGIPASRLMVMHQPGQTNSYSLSQSNNSDRPFEAVALTNLFTAFAGTDFSPGDLGLEFFHWPKPVFLRSEMRKGRSCRVVQSINPQPGGTYARVLSWIDLENKQPVRAEAYDSANRLLKSFSVTKVGRDDSRWRLKEIEMLNEQTDSRTRLELDLEINDPAK